MLGDYNLDYYAFEIRYANAYRLWDAAGQISEIITQHFKEVKLNKAEPGLISFIINRDITLEIRLERTNFVRHNPPLDFAKDAEDLTFVIDLVLQTLNIHNIDRLGTRLVYVKPFSDKQKMSEYLRQYVISKAASSKFFNVEPAYVKPSLYLQVEDDEFGYHFRFTAKTEKVSFDLGAAVKDVDPVDKERIYAAIDVDLYTVKMLEARALRLPDWLDKVVRAVRRDVDKVLLNLED